MLHLTYSHAIRREAGTHGYRCRLDRAPRRSVRVCPLVSSRSSRGPPALQGRGIEYLILYGGSGKGGDLSEEVDFKYDNAQILIRMPQMATGDLRFVVISLKSYAAKNPLEGVGVSFGGALMYDAEMDGLLVEGQIESILISVVVIALCYMLVFRSVAAGLFAVIPLIVAVFSSLGLMAAFHIDLDYMIAILFSVAIGAGTDYTAYFLSRLRERARIHGDTVLAYRETMSTIGKGIVFNGLSVVVGFSVYFLSGFVPVIYFGLLIAFSILVCIIGAITVLPASILCMRPPKFLK
jgi:uncharacterized protein